MTIFVFGAGTIGLALEKYFHKHNVEVQLFSNQKELNRITVSNPLSVQSYGNLSTTSPVIQNASAIVTTRIDLLDQNSQTKIYQDIQFLLRSKIPVMNFSSVAIYGDSEEFKSELATADPVNLYGHSKLNIEKILASLEGAENLTNLRISNLFGLAGFGDFTNLSILRIRRGEALNIPFGECSRDFIDVFFLFKFLHHWVETRVNLPLYLNFASNRSCLLTDWASTIANTLNRKLILERSFQEQLVNSHIDNSLLSQFWPERFPDSNDLLREYINRVEK
jgi:nucleoside-diphosphate-sugar epimerase